MRAPTCVACGGTVLELRGESAMLDSYLTDGGEPPASTAGAWHATCLAASAVGPRWHAAQRRSLVEVRGYRVVAEPGGWLVVEHARSRERVALAPYGLVLALRFEGAPRPSPGGCAIAVHEPEYNLELADTALITDMQAALRATGEFSLAELARRLGITERLAHPALWRTAAFTLDPELTADWSAGFVAAAVRYDVFVPELLVPFLAS